MKFLIIVGALVCAAQAKTNVCEVGNPSGKCAPTQPYCSKGYECIDGDCCQAKERLCPHNQRSHGLCDDNGQCPDPGHQCYTTDDDQRVCCNKNLPTPKQRDCLSGKPCESSENCQKSYHCIEGNCCKISTSGDADSCPVAYDSNPLLGCYILVEESNLVTYDYAKQRCANDGGALLLIDSKEKLAEIQILLDEKGMKFIIVQGSRSPGSAVWVTDDGIPLSLPTDLYRDDTPDDTVLVLGRNSDYDDYYDGGGFFFYAFSPEFSYFEAYACEIEN